MKRSLRVRNKEEGAHGAKAAGGVDGGEGRDDASLGAGEPSISGEVVVLNPSMNGKEPNRGRALGEVGQLLGDACSRRERGRDGERREPSSIGDACIIEKRYFGQLQEASGQA
ncbi:unnamed protein product [Ilex paraguariensis]|uniref:Uncharacterized protein n=1 Tax=Ilex paraguariensis TaxID=185542 RepID=A0ABC8RVW8_9AQUA